MLVAGVEKVQGVAGLERAAETAGGHEGGPFVVVIRAGEPVRHEEDASVIEDEARLRDPASRTRLMRAVAQAIDTHFGEPMKVASR